jgi:hypothetical protein
MISGMLLPLRGAGRALCFTLDPVFILSVMRIIPSLPSVSSPPARPIRRELAWLLLLAAYVGYSAFVIADQTVSPSLYVEFLLGQAALIASTCILAVGWREHRWRWVGASAAAASFVLLLQLLRLPLYAYACYQWLEAARAQGSFHLTLP